MPTIITTALMGFFLLSANGGAIVSEVAKKPVLPTYETLSVSMTGYNAVPEQTDGDPFTTASGAYSNPDIVIARSVDLAQTLPFGTVVEVVVPESANQNCGIGQVEHLIGYRVVADSMHPRKRNQLDILFDTDASVTHNGKDKNAAIVMGVCKEIEVRVVGKIDIKNMPKNQSELLASVLDSNLALR